jgi:hypothetical protein
MFSTRNLFGGIALLSIALFAAGVARAQEHQHDKDAEHGHDHGHDHDQAHDHDHDHGHAHGEKAHGHDHGKEMDPKMAAWMKYANPGEHHEHLKPLAGTWDLAVKYRMAPDAPWQESQAEGQVRWILGGRYLEERITSEVEGQPFEGLGIYGYDNYNKYYTSFWMDSMSTMTLSTTGRCDASGKEFTFTGTYNDAFTGKKATAKYIWRVINETKHTVESYEQADDGTEYKNMEIVYTRK